MLVFTVINYAKQISISFKPVWLYFSNCSEFPNSC